ncbi:MAG TPA: hypothetical protein VLB72_12250, partial [Burkholderiales bacterium]|nr:hypothetical protein [Burkholderiales bacterium]
MSSTAHAIVGRLGESMGAVRFLRFLCAGAAPAAVGAVAAFAAATPCVATQWVEPAAYPVKPIRII